LEKERSGGWILSPFLGRNLFNSVQLIEVVPTSVRARDREKEKRKEAKRRARKTKEQLFK
jgi:hypothetical protein